MREYNNLRYYLADNFPSNGVTFVDFTPTLTDYNSLSNTIKNLVKLIDQDIDYIIAPDARGFIWGMAIAKELEIGMIPIRKKGKLPMESIQDSYSYQTEYSTDTLELPKISLKDKKCLFVDDVYATGGTYKACKEMITKAGGTMNQGIVLYNIMIHNNDEIKYLVNPKNIL